MLPCPNRHLVVGAFQSTSSVPADGATISAWKRGSGSFPSSSVPLILLGSFASGDFPTRYRGLSGTPTRAAQRREVRFSHQSKLYLVFEREEQRTVAADNRFAPARAGVGIEKSPPQVRSRASLSMGAQEEP